MEPIFFWDIYIYIKVDAILFGNFKGIPFEEGCMKFGLVSYVCMYIHIYIYFIINDPLCELFLEG